MLFNMSQAEVIISAFMIPKNKYVLDDLGNSECAKKRKYLILAYSLFKNFSQNIADSLEFIWHQHK